MDDHDAGRAVIRPDRKGTTTSRFGVGKRESHDASDFYARFTPTRISTDEDVHGPLDLPERVICGDARAMRALPDNSVALVVTSPPYYAGKEYEAALGVGGVPASYFHYLQLLRDVFAECARVLEPGGRIAVNVANLGRRPYRSLAADVINILDGQLGLLLRGEVVWVKADGAAGSCAWGSYRSPTNPVLRDLTERVIVASKGRFDRAVSVEQRRAGGLPWEASISTDEFLEATLDHWRLAPESARRVGHPAPFPVELPTRLIDLYTFRDDLVLDPFLGSGTTAVAALRRGRRYVGYDLDPDYVGLARRRVRDEESAAEARAASSGPLSPALFPGPKAGPDGEGRSAPAVAADLLVDAGFTIRHRNHKIPGLGLSVSLVADDRLGRPWYFDVTGAFSVTRSGLARPDTLWKSLGRASVLSTRGLKPIVLMTSDLPPRRSTGDGALRAVGWRGIHDVVGLLDGEGGARLARYASGAHRDLPLGGFWTEADLRTAS